MRYADNVLAAYRGDARKLYSQGRVVPAAMRVPRITHTPAKQSRVKRLSRYAAIADLGPLSFGGLF